MPAMPMASPAWARVIPQLALGWRKKRRALSAAGARNR